MIFFHALYAADLCLPMMEEWDKAAEELDEGILGHTTKINV